MTLSISGKNLSFSREDIEIFSGVNFSLESGDLLLLKGSNGSGKTTLLRILATLIKGFAGDLLFNGIPVLDSQTEYRSSIVYAGHKLACFLNRTVAENLLFWANAKCNHELFLPTLHFLDLERIQDVIFSKLSAGWQKRVSLSRLLLFNAKIWILDEPFINLDAHSRDIISNLVKIRLHNGGIVVIALHGEFHLNSVRISKLNMDLH